VGLRAVWHGEAVVAPRTTSQRAGGGSFGEPSVLILTSASVMVTVLPVSTPAPARNRQNWRQLQKRKGRREVSERLGLHAQVDNMGSLEYWYSERKRHLNPRDIVASAGRVPR
jgi:hypothetical protein